MKGIMKGKSARHNAPLKIEASIEISNKIFDKVIKTYNFNQNFDEACAYKKIHKILIFMVLFMNNIIFIGNDVRALSSRKAWLVQ